MATGKTALARALVVLIGGVMSTVVLGSVVASCTASPDRTDYRTAMRAASWLETSVSFIAAVEVHRIATVAEAHRIEGTSERAARAAGDADAKLAELERKGGEVPLSPAARERLAAVQAAWKAAQADSFVTHVGALHANVVNLTRDVALNDVPSAMGGLAGDPEIVLLVDALTRRIPALLEDTAAASSLVFMPQPDETADRERDATVLGIVHAMEDDQRSLAASLKTLEHAKLVRDGSWAKRIVNSTNKFLDLVTQQRELVRTAVTRGDRAHRIVTVGFELEEEGAHAARELSVLLGAALNEREDVFAAYPRFARRVSYVAIALAYAMGALFFFVAGLFGKRAT